MPIIVNLRGTSGAGKSFLTRRIMALYTGQDRQAVMMANRRRPIGYLCRHHLSEHDALWVMGHYETPCGGCDTVPTMELVYEGVRGGVQQGHDVLYEGLLVQSDVNRLIQLKKDGYDARVIRLNTPIAECVASIEQRRRDRGDERPLDPGNTRKKDGAINLTLPKLRAAGLPVLELNREDAFQKLCEWFRL